jgi:hypothetical protein
VLFYFIFVFSVFFVGHGRKGSVSRKVPSLKGKNCEDLEDVVKLNQIKEKIKSEFIKLESKSDWIRIWIMYISWYFGHNF